MCSFMDPAGTINGESPYCSGTTFVLGSSEYQFLTQHNRCNQADFTKGVKGSLLILVCRNPVARL